METGRLRAVFRNGNDGLAHTQPQNIPVLHHFSGKEAVVTALGVIPAHVGQAFALGAVVVLNKFDGGTVGIGEADQCAKSGEDTVSVLLAVGFDNLTSILDGNDEFRTQTAAKVYAVGNVVKMGQQAEFVNDEIYIALGFFAAQGFLDC